MPRTPMSAPCAKCSQATSSPAVLATDSILTRPFMEPHMASPVLLTDLYELTMLQAYHAERMNGRAVFELFMRALPPTRNFLLAAGLAQVVAYLLALRFDAEDRAWLRSTGRFTPAFVESLADLRFTGDVDAMPEGSVFFPD